MVLKYEISLNQTSALGLEKKMYKMTVEHLMISAGNYQKILKSYQKNSGANLKRFSLVKVGTV